MTWLCICRYIGYHRIMCACTTLKQEHAFVGVCVPFIVRSPGIGCLKSGEPSTGPSKNGGDWRCVFLELGRVQSATAWCMICFVHGTVNFWYFSELAELSQNKPHGRSRPSDGRNPRRATGRFFRGFRSSVLVWGLLATSYWSGSSKRISQKIGILQWILRNERCSFRLWAKLESEPKAATEVTIWPLNLHNDHRSNG